MVAALKREGPRRRGAGMITALRQDKGKAKGAALVLARTKRVGPTLVAR